MRQTPLLLSALLLLPAASAAQSPGSWPLVAELPASTRAMALGNAYMMNAGHADAVFYHPGLLRSASGFGASVQRWGEGATSAAFSGAVSWLGGGIAVGVLTLNHAGGAAPGPLSPSGQSHLFLTGSSPIAEQVAVLGYGRSLFGLDIGVTGKLVEERIGVSTERVAMVDVGAATDAGPLRVGLTVRDIGPDPLTGDDTPRVVLGAGAYGEQLGILDVGLTAAAEWNEDRTTVSGGVEVGYWPISGRTFVARIGVRDPYDGMSPVSFGAAFWGDDVTVEWAFQPYTGSESAGTHSFGLRWR